MRINNGVESMEKIVKKDQEYIKQSNKSMVLNIIKIDGPISRADIGKITGMSPTSVSRIAASLIEQGLVKETELYSNGVGRKAILLDIDMESVMTIGVYLNKNITMIGIVNFGGEVLFYEKTKLDTKNEPELVIKKLCDKIENLLTKSGVDINRIVGVGVGLPGIIDAHNGVVVFSAQLGWKNVNVIKEIEKNLGLKAVVDNDVKLKALGESLYGSAKNSKSTALISIGSGVGSALIINGEIFRGETNIAGEIGHITLDPNGMFCDCGRRGCLQTFIVEDRLLLEANNIRPTETVKEIIVAADNSEDWAINILDRVATYICIAINNTVCMYNPDSIILAGKLIEENPGIIPFIEKKNNASTWEPLRGNYKIVYSQLEQKTDIIGGATLASKTFLDL